MWMARLRRLAWTSTRVGFPHACRIGSPAYLWWGSRVFVCAGKYLVFFFYPLDFTFVW